jgi:endoglucanase
MPDPKRFRRVPLALVCLLLALTLPACSSASESSTSESASESATAEPWIGVRGNRLIDRTGKTVRLLGVNRSSAEYACVEEGVIFEGPTDEASIRAMKSWRINSVRVPLNESCWLGINGVDPELSGENYRRAVREYVDRLLAADLYVILDLHWAAPFDHQATGLLPLPDAEYAPEFWRSVATEFREDSGVLFDVYNEPHDVTWECWASPCRTFDHWFGWYPATGLPQLLEAIRSTGARQPVLLSGIDWARDLRGWLAHVPDDPADAIVAANHTYNFSACERACRQALIRISRKYPVVTSELGQNGCKRDYVNDYMRFADRNGISYLGWTWSTGGRWECATGPSLIRDWAGSPTRYGVALRKHLRRLARS